MLEHDASALRGERRPISRPCRWIVPASGCSKPATSLRIVVLPAPLGEQRHELARFHRELDPVDGDDAAALLDPMELKSGGARAVIESAPEEVRRP